MIWFETTTRIDSSTGTGKLIVLVTNLPIIMYSIGGVILAIGLAFIGITGFRHWSASRNLNTPYKKGMYA